MAALPQLGLCVTCLAAVPTLVSLAGVCEGLISSGCVSPRSGPRTGLAAVPGTGAAALGLLGGHHAGPSEQSWAHPIPGPAAWGRPMGGALRSEREVALGGTLSPFLGCILPLQEDPGGQPLLGALHQGVSRHQLTSPASPPVSLCAAARTSRMGTVVQGSG